MKRFWTLLALGGAGLLLTPVAASAQFLRPLPQLQTLPTLGVPSGFGGAPVIVPSVNPFFYAPRYYYTRSFGVNLGGTSVGFQQTYVGINRPGIYVPPFRYSVYGQSGSYITAAPNVNANAWLAAQRNLAAAQREAGLPGAKAAIAEAWDFEKGNKPAPVAAVPEANPAPAALAPVVPAAIYSGEALNAVLKEALAADAQKANRPSGYIPPLLLDDVRFAHTPAGDLLNLARQAGALKFPAAFDAPALAPLRAEVDKQFATVAATVQAGRAPDPAQVGKLEVALRKLQGAAGPVVKDLPFEEAIPARHFLNELAGAAKAMKGTAATGLMDPKWTTEGLTVAELVRHMGKYKLQFGPAPRGAEEAYASLYRDLATYLAVLQMPKK